MKYILLFTLILISGCDTFYGLRLPVKPAYEGSWDCVYDNIASINLKAERRNENQLSISSNENGKYLFSVMPKYGNEMELYYMQMHAAPSCEETDASLKKMKEFLKLMEQHCGYKSLSYEASMECSSNKAM
ncbi:hypothetical protein [Shewanella sp. Koi 1]